MTPKPIISESWPEVLADGRSPLVRPHVRLRRFEVIAKRTLRLVSTHMTLAITASRRLHHLGLRGSVNWLVARGARRPAVIHAEDGRSGQGGFL